MNAIVLPNRRIEEWKYSDVVSAVDGTTVGAAPTAVWSIAAQRGNPDISDLGPGAPVGSHGAMGILASSLAKSGLSVRVCKGKSAFLSLDLMKAGHGHAVIVVEDGASLRLVEKQDSSDFANIAVTISIGPNARVDHVRIALRGGAVRVADYAISVSAGATYRAHLADFGAKLSRTELHLALVGEGAQALLSGVSVLDSVQADVTTHVTHAVGGTNSGQLFKYIAGGEARGIYQGKVTVAKGANGSDSRQTAKGLLLRDRAEIDLKPELEILADDVKCAHGAAIGDLDEESLFYLRLRGIQENEARALLMRAFLGDVVEEIEDEMQRETVWKAVDAALERVS